MNLFPILRRLARPMISTCAGMIGAVSLVATASTAFCASSDNIETLGEQAEEEPSSPTKKRDPWILKPGAGQSAKQVAPFELKDQHGVIHSRKFPTSKPVLLVIADPRASRKLKEWTTPLGGQLKDRVDVVAVADLSQVPENFRSMALESVRKKRTEKVLMDWEGQVSKPLECRPNVPNLALVSTNGTLLLQVGSAATKALIAEFLGEAEKLLDPPGLAARRDAGER